MRVHIFFAINVGIQSHTDCVSITFNVLANVSLYVVVECRLQFSGHLFILELTYVTYEC